MSKVQTLYYEKDIRFLLHEPIVWKFREFKVNMSVKLNSSEFLCVLGVSEEVEESIREEELGHGGEAPPEQA